MNKTLKIFFLINIVIIIIYIYLSKEIIFENKINTNSPINLSKSIISEPRIFKKYIYIKDIIEFQDIIYDKNKSSWILNLFILNKDFKLINDNLNKLNIEVTIDNLNKNKIQFRFINSIFNIDINIYFKKLVLFETKIIFKNNLLHISNHFSKYIIKKYIDIIFKQLTAEIDKQNQLRLKFINK